MRRQFLPLYGTFFHMAIRNSEKRLDWLVCTNAIDLNDSSTFAKILTGCWAAPKGPYSLGYVAPGKQMQEKIKAKGIPHPSGPFPYGEEIDVHANIEQMSKDAAEKLVTRDELFERAKAYLKDPSHKEPPVEIIGNQFYLWQSPQGEAYVAKHLNQKLILLMMSGQGMNHCDSCSVSLTPFYSWVLNYGIFCEKCVLIELTSVKTRALLGEDINQITLLIEQEHLPVTLALSRNTLEAPMEPSLELPLQSTKEAPVKPLGGMAKLSESI